MDDFTNLVSRKRVLRVVGIHREEFQSIGTQNVPHTSFVKSYFSPLTFGGFPQSAYRYPLTFGNLHFDTLLYVF